MYTEYEIPKYVKQTIKHVMQIFLLAVMNNQLCGNKYFQNEARDNVKMCYVLKSYDDDGCKNNLYELESILWLIFIIHLIYRNCPQHYRCSNKQQIAFAYHICLYILNY